MAPSVVWERARLEQLARQVDADHDRALRRQVPGESSLTAAQVEDASTADVAGDQRRDEPSALHGADELVVPVGDAVVAGLGHGAAATPA